MNCQLAMNATTPRPLLKTLLEGLRLGVLLLLPFAVTLWIWADTRSVPLYVLSGALFRSSWWVGHAGFCLDQPTIGKWYCWTTIFGGVWCFTAFFATRACRNMPPVFRRPYAVATLAVAVFHLCLLTLPFTWTVQYIRAMGITPHRSIALAWGIVGYAILIGLTASFVRQALRGERSQADKKTGGAPEESP